MMIEATILLILASSASAIYPPNLKVRFANTTEIGTEAFIPCPLSNSSALESGWVKMNRTSRHEGMSSLVLWCPTEDYSFCVYYDDTGYPAGIQFAIAICNCSNVFNMTVQGYDTWTTTLNGTEQTFYTLTQYYVSNETLATDPETRIANRNSSVLIQGDNIWVDGFYGELMNISTTASYVTSDTSPYTVQNCYAEMGTHYYYNLTTTTECRADTLSPWFPIIHDDQVVALGCVLFCAIESGTKFETSGKTGIEIILNNGPQCLYDLGDELMTMHTYFISDPYYITCE